MSSEEEESRPCCSLMGLQGPIRAQPGAGTRLLTFDCTINKYNTGINKRLFINLKNQVTGKFIGLLALCVLGDGGWFGI